MEAMKNGSKSALTDFSIALRDTFGIELSSAQLSPLANDRQQLTSSIQSYLDKDIENKKALAGEENLNLFIKYQYLQEIDNKWLDHLENMEALREAVYLRSYAQKNPLLEYKIEGSEIFEQLVDAIRKNIASRVYRVRISAEEERRPAAKPGIPAQVIHESTSSFSASQQSQSESGLSAPRQSSAMANAASGEGATVVRTMPKVGRNDPCPCGSGKKYKHCHGR